jgi:ABC-2 type transport system ATP-binding protein
MTPAVRCTNLVKHYEGRPPVEAVRGLDLTVRQGECFGLLGPNGAGKSTTIEMIEGLLAPTSGQVEVLGLAWGKNDEAIRQRIGVTLQETRLSTRLTAKETVALFRSFYDRGIVPIEALRRVSLDDRANIRVGKLSNGQRQRLSIACALVGDPELLLLDEPTTGLDPPSRRQLWNIIGEIRSRQCTVLLTTHYMDEAEQLCDRVAIIDRGQLLALDSPRGLIDRLGGEHVIEFTLDNSAGREAAVAEEFSRLPTVKSVHTDDHRINLSVTEPHVTLPALLNQVEQQQCRLTSLTTRHASLEDVFLELAGHSLEDAETPTE